MDPEIDTRQTSAVEVEVHSSYRSMYPGGDPAFVPTAFQWAVDCFTGNYRDYQPIDALYHDLEHTLQGTLCMARLLRGRREAGAAPEISQRLFELGLLAILLHDTGYLKEKDDREGTGAKYTAVHVSRSVIFAGELLAEKGFAPGEVLSVQNMIRCTGVNADLGAIPFQSEAEKLTGFALGTSDLLGQMAARDYVQKLPVLYLEFEEAALHAPGGPRYESAADLMRRTPLFWENYVKLKIEKDFQGVYRFLNQPLPGGRNRYIERIEANITRLRKEIEPAS